MANQVLVGAAPWVAASGGEQKYGLFRLGDDGTWFAVTCGLPPKVEVRSLTVDASNPDIVYAATQMGPYRSQDGGDSWHSLGLEPQGVAWSVAIHPQDSNVLLVGTTDGGIHRSDDAGRCWRRLPTIMPEGVCKMGFPTRMLRVAINPSNPDEMYAALEVGGVIRSLDAGASWHSCNRGLLRFCEHERYRSRIGSDTDSEGMMDSHALVVTGADANKVILANRLGLFCSEDRGDSWQDMDIARFSALSYARDVCVSPHDADTLFGAFSVAAVSDEGSLYRSHDGGASWQRFDHGLTIASTLMTIATSAHSADRVYCASRRGQVFGTEDGGATWNEWSLPDGVQGVYAIACH